MIPFTSIETICVEGKKLIHINVYCGGRILYYLTNKGLKPSGVYVRHAVTAVTAGEKMIRQMIRERDGVTYDKARFINQELTLSDIMRGVSQSRNMVLANIFYRLKLIESYGTGIQRILESYQNNGKPEFLPEASSFVTILPNVQILHKEEVEHTDYATPEKEVLDLFKDKKEITRKDVEKLLGCSSFPVRKVLNSLVKKNKISVVGNARATRYVLNGGKIAVRI